MENVFDILKERGFIEQITDEEGIRELVNTPQTVYCGFDPTADSLHLGSLIPVLGLMHFQRTGHKVFALLGGATGMIGDPSGKDQERSFLNEEALFANVEGQRKQLSKLLPQEDEGDKQGVTFVNNYDWMKDISLIRYLRLYGKHFSVNAMMAKESVRRRLEDRSQGISYTEFSYMCLQSIDFLQLNARHGCRLQVGGGDQWGNITSGIDLIRRFQADDTLWQSLGEEVGGSDTKRGEQTYGLTFPLLTSADGKKFGKSEKGAIFLDAERTSVWDFYQYLIRREDSEVVKLLKLFTFLPMAEIAELEKQVQEHPEQREAQKRLAWEVTAMVHGAEQADKMKLGAEALYAGDLTKLDGDLVRQIFAAAPQFELSQSALEEGVSLVDVVADGGLLKSKGEAKRMLKQGAMYVNNERQAEERLLTSADLLPSKTIILRKGKKDYLIVKVG